MSDFGFDDYERLLDAIEAGGHEILRVRDYVRRDLPRRFVVLRHDVDRRAGHADRMAELEARKGITSTYYLRTSTFTRERAERLRELGHEVGYHYEDYVDANGDLERAHALFGANLREFRRVVPVETVCMHGNPLSPHDNREMWTANGAPGLDEYDLLAEAYLSMDFGDVTYFSDTGRTWRDGPLKIKDHTMGEGEKSVSADATSDLVELFRDGDVERACVLAHPERWADSLSGRVVSVTTDRAVNLVKRGMRLL